MDDQEYEVLERRAVEVGLTLSEWVRQTLRNADRCLASGDVPARLRAIRVAAAHEFPAPDIDQMLAEIEQAEDPRG
jgi:hypothetical protein